MFDSLIKAVYDAGLSRVVYYIFHVLSFAAVFLFAFRMRKNYHLDKILSKLKYAAFVMLLFASMYIWMILLYTVATGKLNGSFNTVRGVVWLPLIAVLFAKLFKVDRRIVCDILAPALCLVQGIGHLGCIFTGCCESRYEWSHGVYNVILQTKLFPIQPVESLICFIIVAVLICIMKRTKYSGAGYLYPLMMVMFGSTRFVCEFIRYNMTTIFGINPLGYHALIITVVGIVWLIVYYCRRKKHPELAVCTGTALQQKKSSVVVKKSAKPSPKSKSAPKKKKKK